MCYVRRYSNPIIHVVIILEAGTCCGGGYVEDI
jgi:hypothetical protein